MAQKPELGYQPLPLPHRAGYSDQEVAERAATFSALMQRRHSVRDFDPRPVSRKVIEDCITAAGHAPSGANQQPWHFAAVSDPVLKHQIRLAAEEEERAFYDGGGGNAWLRALEPIGTGPEKPHLDIAPWLIVIFAQRWGIDPDGNRAKHYYVPESVGIATGVLITALHTAGLVTLTHTPNPMKFLNGLLGRPAEEKPVMILVTGHPAGEATVPAAAKVKKPLDQILTVRDGT